MSESKYHPFPPEKIKRWPWWLRWLEPHHAEDRRRFLVQCQCGRVLWLDAPSRIKKLHDGHMMKPCMNSTVRNFVKMKLGLLDRFTWSERFQLLMARLSK
jgi:hypothetical protein